MELPADQAVPAISLAAREENTDPIILSRRAEEGMTHGDIRNIPKYGTRHPSIPLLVLKDRELPVEGTAPPHSLRILLPVDGTAHSETVFAPAVQFLQAVTPSLPGEIHLFHVIDAPSMPGKVDGQNEATDFMHADFREQAEAYGQSLLDWCHIKSLG